MLKYVITELSFALMFLDCYLGIVYKNPFYFFAALICLIIGISIIIK